MAYLLPEISYLDPDSGWDLDLTYITGKHLIQKEQKITKQLGI